ncbi:MAG TPA: 23S rRNA (guanosine(2251)-2'-O)-methyltransferase RlmB [Sedimentibacter sp.]|jgi:TrmH family RNA methyltransferase|nr:23S rRNA (guanosine(2251)-2'-O)-methyltransferase RlmB [Sedimentibacter sp.]HHY99472.1 23S rRNA (guanosine(2251)-2'-O)-methyltransferase RlmB [Tissierellia bacterium]HOK48833.1 23S rRNA (guanosine(2251)-2'-O)-methyltransferase RlmB [Sedimentibacter sp.]HOW22442.1 23S rRNA (guanosine(2251)-2'-O)-methyltransferase RlmB [Sedimentibacter sp.]HRC81745.1 23S rRNA (guanosine(2251)-2'-O)-methyltransferase RlmB [Sedimentibacter sp.]
MDIIRSKDNGKIKYIRNLYIKKFRDQEKAFVVEGVKFVSEALREKADIKLLLVSEEVLDKNEINKIMASMDKSKVLVCSAKVFESAADTVNAQGVLAVISKNSLSPNEITDKYPFVIMCDRIQDPGNLGAIMRSADAFGPAALILNKGCVDAYNPKVVRASAGALFRIPMIFAEDDGEIINILKNKGYYLVSTVVDSEYTFDNMDNRRKICLVIGNEGQGVADHIIKDSDIALTIKMSGKAESLNASVAAGICIYEIRKKLLK